jgi:hypothetical protein
MPEDAAEVRNVARRPAEEQGRIGARWDVSAVGRWPADPILVELYG